MGVEISGYNAGSLSFQGCRNNAVLVVVVVVLGPFKLKSSKGQVVLSGLPRDLAMHLQQKSNRKLTVL